MEKALGALPVKVIEALVANRLTSPTPLLRVEDRARDRAVAEVLGVSAETLNDDRAGRAGVRSTRWWGHGGDESQR